MTEQPTSDGWSLTTRNQTLLTLRNDISGGNEAHESGNASSTGNGESANFDPGSKFPTHEAFKAALNGIPEQKDKESLSREVARIVSEQLKIARDSGKKFLMLLGENHGRASSLAMAMAALKAIHDGHELPATVMFEFSPDQVDELRTVVPAQLNSHMPEDVHGIHADQVDQTKLDPRINSKDYSMRASWHNFVKVFCADRLGFPITSFDTARDGSMPEREKGMVKSIKQQVAAGAAPAVVMVGNMHIPILHEALQGDAHIVTLVTLNQAWLPETDDAYEDYPERRSYLVAHDSINLLRTSDKFDTEAFSFVKFATRLGIDVAKRA